MLKEALNLIRASLSLQSLYQNLPFPSGLPRSLSSKESACQCRRCRFNPRVRKMPRRRKWQPTPVFLPGESRGQRTLVGYNPRGHKESDTTEARSHAHPLPLGRIGLYLPPRQCLLNQHVVTGPTGLHNNRWYKAIKTRNKWNSNIYSTNHMRLICCCSL